MLVPDFIMTAQHAHRRVKTEADYRARQVEFVAGLRAEYPNIRWKDPWISTARPQAFVSGGRWLVECECGNCPVIEPGWSCIGACRSCGSRGPRGGACDCGGTLDGLALALCFECGAIYEGIEMPSDRAGIEADLLTRRAMNERYWVPTIVRARAIDLSGGVV